MTKRIDVFNAKKYGKDFPTDNAVEFNAWLKEIIDSVPKENRGDLKIDLDSISSRDSDYATIEIYYDRDETEAELKEISKNKERKEKLEVQRKRDLLDRLKLELGET